MSGQVSSDAHCEPLQLLAELGVFGAVVGLAIWGFAWTAAFGRAQSADRWLAAAFAAAITAAFVDAATGVSWRLAGPAPFLAMPVALTWMLCRTSPPDEPAPQPPAPRRRRRLALLLALAGVAAGFAGVTDFEAARCLFRAQSAMHQAEQTLASDTANASSQNTVAHRPHIIDQLSRAQLQADFAARWHLDPPRRLASILAGARLRATLGCLPLRPGADPEFLKSAPQILDAALATLRRLEAVAPGYADVHWRVAELLDTKASLAARIGYDVIAAQNRREALAAALDHFGERPLDRERIWQSFSIWPELPPVQRLSLLRGVLREEGEVWRHRAPSTAVYAHWARQRGYVMRMWQQLSDQADSVDRSFMETGYSSLRLAYRQWPDPLAAEAVRLTAVRRVLQGNPAQAADALELANLLYRRAKGFLPYSQAATCVDLAACRIRQGTDQWVRAVAAIVQAKRILAPLPDSVVRAELLALANELQQGIEAAAGLYAGGEPDPWLIAVDLFWEMPPQMWPADIQAWAERADTGSAAKGGPATVILQLRVGLGDTEGGWKRIEQMMSRGASRTAVEAALREATYRWPFRQPTAAALMQRLRSKSQPAGP